MIAMSFELTAEALIQTMQRTVENQNDIGTTRYRVFVARSMKHHLTGSLCWGVPIEEIIILIPVIILLSSPYTM